MWSFSRLPTASAKQARTVPSAAQFLFSLTTRPRRALSSPKGTAGTPAVCRHDVDEGRRCHGHEQGRMSSCRPAVWCVHHGGVSFLNSQISATYENHVGANPHDGSGSGKCVCPETAETPGGPRHSRVPNLEFAVVRPLGSVQRWTGTSRCSSTRVAEKRSTTGGV